MHNTMLVLMLLALVLAILKPSITISMPKSSKTGGCIYYNSLKGYDCVGNNLPSIPQELSSSIEVLDVSFNRIRELTRDMLKNYPSLQKLYLNDNMIMTIESDTFNDLPNLDTLDLTMNALVEIPSTILHMPSLKKLMLAKNTRLDILSFFNNAGEITAPIQYLDISYNPLLTHLPNFNIMMDLVHLNITGNHVTNISKTNFIGLCNLKLFSNHNLTMEFATACDCAQIDRWFELKNVKSKPEFASRCNFAIDKCTEDIEPNPYDLITHDKCLSEFQVRETLRSALQICFIVFGVIGGLLLVAGVCYVYYRFQRFPDDNEIKNVKKDLKNDKGRALLTKEYESSNI